MARAFVSVDRIRGIATAPRGAALPIHKAIATSTPASKQVSGPIAEVLLLAGGIRPKGFRAELGRSLLDVPVDAQRRLLDLWCEQINQMAGHFGWDGIRVRVLIDGSAVAPRPCVGEVAECAPTIERDAGPYRGTGGVIRDACAEIDPAKYVLVCNAFQMLLQPLDGLVERLLASDAELSFSSEPCGGAGGIFLIQGSCLKEIPPMGFVDLKEQAIPLIARQHRVKVAATRSSDVSGLPVRSLREYIAALRHRHSVGFAIVEPGAVVDANARLHDSVVLRGGRVESGAIVASSLVTARGVVGAGHCVIDAVVGGYR